MVIFTDRDEYPMPLGIGFNIKEMEGSNLEQIYTFIQLNFSTSTLILKI